MADSERTRLGEMLLTAAGLETTELAGYLDSLAAEQPELAAEVRRRVQVTGAVPASFLDIPAPERIGRSTTVTTHSPVTTKFAAPADNPAPIAKARKKSSLSDTAAPVSERYSLGACLGQGGMARVFRAVDHKLSRTIALKFLTRDEPAIVSRFLREARAQARVSHDHVLEVYETGEMRDRPYIAMRHIDGGTLREVQGDLSLEQKVRLMIQVAKGLHAAHSSGLIHRDVKPSNILVEETSDGDLKAYVADFGIATETANEKDLEGPLVGSPPYIAPELVTGDNTSVDRRVDVFSLGITLYELFTGRRPFDHEEPYEVLRKIVHEQPKPARQVMASLPAELEALVMRCLAKDPDDRYPSARAVAEDLQRFLDGEVVEAHAASRAYRWARFALRHQRLLWVSAISVVALIAASVLIAVFALRADQERVRAELRRGQAEELIGFMLGNLRDKLASAERLEILDDVSNEALEYFAAVPAAELTDDELAQRSKLLYQIGEVRVQKGDVAGAVEPFQDSLELAQHLFDRYPQDGQRLFDLSQSHFWLGYAHWRQADVDRALEQFQAYLDLAQRLTRLDPENLDWRLELSYAHSNLGSSFETQGDFAAALEQFERARAIEQSLVDLQPEQLDWRFALAESHDSIARVLRLLGRLHEAKPHYTKDLALKRSLVAARPSNLQWREFLGTVLEQEGALLMSLGEAEPASARFSEAKALFSSLVDQDPDNSERRYKLAWSLIWLGRAAYADGHIDQAMSNLSTACQMLESDAEAHQTNRVWQRAQAICLKDLGGLELFRSQDAAELHIRSSVEMLERLVAASPDDLRTGRWLGEARILLGRLASEKGNEDDARKSWLLALEALEPLARSSQDGRVLAPWAEALLRLQRPTEAQPILDRLQAQGYRSVELSVLCRSQGIDY